jgi:hypothetical protein
MSNTSRLVWHGEGRITKPVSIPVDHTHLGAKGDGKGWEYIEVKVKPRSKAYSSNRTKPRKKKK